MEKNRADQLREFVLSTEGELKDIRQLFESIQGGWSGPLCAVTGEKLRAWRRGLYDGIHELSRQWPFPQDPAGPSTFVDYFIDRAFIAVSCRIVMLQGALEGIERENTSDPALWESVSGCAPFVLDEIWEELVAATEKFIAKYLPDDEFLLSYQTV